MEDEIEPPGPAALAASALVFYAFATALGLILITWQDLDLTLVIFGDGEATGRDTLVGAGAGLVIVGLTRLSMRFDAVRALNHELAGLLGSPGSGVILILALASAVGEEVLFRGALQPLLGLLVTAVIFGLAHGGFKARLRLWAIFATGAGLLLGWLTLWTENLLAAILCHFTVNYFNLHMMIHGDEGDGG